MQKSIRKLSRVAIGGFMWNLILGLITFAIFLISYFRKDERDMMFFGVLAIVNLILDKM